MNIDAFLKSFVEQNTPQTQDNKPATTQISFPLFMQPMMVVTVNEKKYNNLLQRLGPWKSHVIQWPGTTEIKRQNWELKQRIRRHCRLTTDELANYDSHVRLWQECVRINQQMFVVEETVDLSQKHADILYLFWRRLEEEKLPFDFVYVGHNNRFLPKTYVTHFVDEPNVVIPRGRQGLFAYLITPKGASYLLNGAIPYEQPIDVYVQFRTENAEHAKFRCYAIYPSPFYFTK